MKISVIVTVLNEEKTIKALLNGLVLQSRTPDEVVIVDGGSTDATWAILEASRERIKKFPLKIFQKKGNRSLGRNFAMAQAKHELIAITDAGCVPHHHWLRALETKMNEATNKRNAVVAGYYEAIAKTSFEEAAVPYFLVMPDQVSYDDFLPATRSMMVHRAVLDKVGRFNESLSDNEDYEFAKRVERYQAQNKKPVLYFTSEAVVKWQPPSTLFQFAKTIFRFARGDVRSGIIRPKVVFLFGRYGVGILVSLLLVMVTSLTTALAFIFLAALTYFGWAVAKNYRYASRGWFWLPLLQLTADLMVMSGSLAALLIPR